MHIVIIGQWIILTGLGGIVASVANKVVMAAIRGYGKTFAGNDSDATARVAVGYPVMTPGGNPVQLYGRQMKYYHTQYNGIKYDYYYQWQHEVTSTINNNVVGTAIALVSGGTMTVLGEIAGAATVSAPADYGSLSNTVLQTRSGTKLQFRAGDKPINIQPLKPSTNLLS